MAVAGVLAEGVHYHVEVLRPNNSVAVEVILDERSRGGMDLPGEHAHTHSAASFSRSLSRHTTLLDLVKLLLQILDLPVTGGFSVLTILEPIHCLSQDPSQKVFTLDCNSLEA